MGLLVFHRMFSKRALIFEKGLLVHLNSSLGRSWQQPLLYIMILNLQVTPAGLKCNFLQKNSLPFTESLHDLPNFCNLLSFPALPFFPCVLFPFPYLVSFENASQGARPAFWFCCSCTAPRCLKCFINNYLFSLHSTATLVILLSPVLLHYCYNYCLSCCC